MRDTFISTLISEARNNKNIILLTGDLGFGFIEQFANEFPDRFFNIGVAEQNMMGIAAGLASEGLHVFTYSIGNFSTWRCAEQIRNDIDYHKLNVTNVIVGGGVTYGNLGYSHHAIQDLSLMRSLPSMLISTPIDPIEVKYCVKYFLKNPSPGYIRLGKSGEVNKQSKIKKIIPGVPNIIKKGFESKCIICINHTIQIGEALIKYETFKNYNLASLPLWSMKSKKNFANWSKKFDEIIIIEDHLEDGGLGSWALESIQNKKKTNSNKIITISLSSDIIGDVGSENFLFKRNGLNIKKIIRNINRLRLS